MVQQFDRVWSTCGCGGLESAEFGGAAGELFLELRGPVLYASEEVNAEPTIDLFRAAFRKAPRETLTGWAHAALHGLKQASTPTHRYNNLVRFATAILSEEWTRPEHSSAILKALKEVSGNDDLGRAALDRVWQRMRGAYSIEDAVTVFLHVISQLEESQRQYGVRLILQTE